MKTPHKHAELIHAWADGAKVEAWQGGEWVAVSNPLWFDETQYRIKPEPKPDVVAKGIIAWNGSTPLSASYTTRFRVSEHYERDNIRLTFDGETGKLKKAEVLE